MILRICQYFFTFFILLNFGEEIALELHFILDTLMNIFGLLYLNSETIFFWFIIS